MSLEAVIIKEYRKIYFYVQCYEEKSLLSEAGVDTEYYVKEYIN